MIIEEEVYLDLVVNDFLAHYGVKGMRWGVRKDRYIQNRTAKREKRAQMYDKRAARTQGSIDKLDQKTYKTDRGRANQAERRQELLNAKKRHETAAAQKRKGRLTREQKVSLAKASIFIGLLVANSVAKRNAQNKAWNSQQRAKDEFFKNWRTYKPSKSVTDLINDERKVKIDAIEKTWREGFMDDAQKKQFTEAIQKRYDRKIADALKDVKG